MKKLLLVCLLSISLLGCLKAGTETTDITNGKTLIATKETIINLHESFRVPCKTGTVPADVCKEVDTLTTEAGPIYDAAADAALLYLKSNNATDLASYQAKNEQFIKLLGDITALTIKYSTKPTGVSK